VVSVDAAIVVLVLVLAAAVVFAVVAAAVVFLVVAVAVVGGAGSGVDFLR